MLANSSHFGDSKAVTNEPTAIIRQPTAPPSIRYSGQCFRIDDRNDLPISRTLDAILAQQQGMARRSALAVRV